MTIKDVSLETVCGITSTFPENKYMELAFAGKSNVGKSSLINALMNRKSLARTSAQPGKTQTINFYRVNCYFERMQAPEGKAECVKLAGEAPEGKAECVKPVGEATTEKLQGSSLKQREAAFVKIKEEGSLYFVDLPGYGYANANEEVKAKWGRMIERYLHTSEMLKAVFLLVDIRHEPNGNDKHMYRWILDQGYAPVIIATKADKINRSQTAKHIKMIKDGLGVVKGTTVIPFSAETKQGRDEIYAFIDAL